MEFGVWTKGLATLQVDCLVLGVFEEGELSGEARSVDAASGGRLKKLLERGDFAGRPGDTQLIADLLGVSATRVLLTGLGTKKLFQRKAWRRACQAALAVSPAPVLAVAPSRSTDRRPSSSMTITSGVRSPSSPAPPCTASTI